MARTPAFDKVLYVTPSATAQYFIPGNCQAPTTSHDNPNNGSEAQRQAANEEVIGLVTTTEVDSCQPGTLAAW